MERGLHKGFGSQQTTIAGWQFDGAQGLVRDQTCATGTNLVTKYPTVYNLGVLPGDGTLLADGVLLADVSVQAKRVFIRGDNTSAMSRVGWLRRRSRPPSRAGSRAPPSRRRAT